VVQVAQETADSKVTNPRDQGDHLSSMDEGMAEEEEAVEEAE